MKNYELQGMEHLQKQINVQEQYEDEVEKQGLEKKELIFILVLSLLMVAIIALVYYYDMQTGIIEELGQNLKKLLIK